MISAWSNGGDTSTTSMPASGSSIAIRRTASSNCRPVRPPGSGVPVPGAIPGSTTSMSTDRKTASQSSVAMVNASDRHSSSPRVTTSVISKLRICWPAIQSSVSGSGQYPRRPICRNRSPRTAPDSISRRIGVPCPYSEPNWVSPVSAWASKWISDSLPQPTCRAVPVASGNVIVWSPPRITGNAPPAQAAWTACSSRVSETSVSPEGISTSPASATRSSASGSTPRARCGRAPSWGR